MPDFERTATVAVDPDTAFRFLADTNNLPKYIATMVLARPEGGERLHVAADVQGRHEEGDTQFRVDKSQRRIGWGAGGPDDYRGSLQVTGSGNGASVRIHLHMQHMHDEPEINRALDETIANIERLLAD